ncbi:zinc-binding alcohol dehydrogenase [Phycisphaerales bacterium AB-hyl4]|uniref:Zinc-binding alcohol dehydrogenase n=1 Tax=Natronomicrosphaera hydrolytica TaxID=3242702 RepID=A0ABV4U6P4_9BACT
MIGHAVVIESRGQAVLKKQDIHPPKAGEVLVENNYSVISAGTEYANLVALPNTSTDERGFPWVPGYSAAGRVIAVGEQVETLEVDDRVVVAWGGHRSHSIKKARDLVKIEDDAIDLLDAAFAHIASFPLLGVRKLRLELGESAMIAGLGILGAFAVQFAALVGAIPVVVSDPDPARRALALKLGASAAFSPSEPGFVDKVKQATGGHGPNTVVEVTGSADALQQALEYIAWEGRIALLGCTRMSDVPIDFYKYVHRRGISLIGAHTFTRAKAESAPGRWTEQDDHRTFLKLIAAGKMQTRPLISEIVSPEHATDVYTRLAENKTMPLGIVFDWKKFRGKA